jgi:N-acylethanolamine-hydrolysing acid amidase
MVPVQAMRVAPEFTIDLAKPPRQRWLGAVGKILALHPWEESFAPLLDYYTSTFYDLIPASNRTVVQNVVRTRFPDEYAELEGISADFAANGHTVAIEWLSQWFWFHEISHSAEMNLALRECTAILALPADPNAPVVHGRNLDQMPLGARNITLTLTFVNSSANVDPSAPAPILFQVVDMYWMSGGFVTGFKSGHVTLQENWRYSDIGPLTLSMILGRIVNDDATVPQVHMFRYALMGQRGMAPRPDFAEVVRFLNGSTFAAPFYGIVSGTDRRGAVISASFDRTTNRVMFLGAADFPSHPWYAVQTNWDQWKPDVNRKRRLHAEHNLADLGQEEGATRLGVWQAISAYPVHNEGTFYTVVMDVTMLRIRGIIRQEMMPYNASCTSQSPL